MQAAGHEAWREPASALSFSRLKPRAQLCGQILTF